MTAARSHHPRRRHQRPHRGAPGPPHRHLPTAAHTTYTSYGVLLIPVGPTDNGWVVAAIFFLQGLPLIACDGTIRSLQQTLIPTELLDRIGAVNRIVDSAVVPISLAAGGLLAHWLGYSAVWIIAGTGFLATLAPDIPALRHLQANSTDLVQGKQPRLDPREQ